MSETRLVEYNITDAAIAEMKSIYMSLSITDIEDKEQFDSVRSARMTVKGKRVEVEKRRKELKADALAYGKLVDTEAKRITGKLEPIENHLDREERKVTDEQKRVKEIADRLEREMIDRRMESLSSFGDNRPFFEVAAMDDGTFELILAAAHAKYEAKKKRLADEEAARKAESERLEKVRQEQEAEAKRLAEVQRKIDEQERKSREEMESANRIERESIEAERRKIAEANAKIEAEKKALEDEKRKEQERKDREVFEAQAKENARIAAEKAEKDRQEREVWEAKEKADREAAEKARADALEPDKHRLVRYGKALMDVPRPELKDKEAKEILVYATGAVYQILKNIAKRAEELK